MLAFTDLGPRKGSVELKRVSAILLLREAVLAAPPLVAVRHHISTEVELHLGGRKRRRRRYRATGGGGTKRRKTTQRKGTVMARHRRRYRSAGGLKPMGASERFNSGYPKKEGRFDKDFGSQHEHSERVTRTLHISIA